jgi:hypothetical protein
MAALLILRSRLREVGHSQVRRLPPAGKGTRSARFSSSITFRFRSILLKNSISVDDGKMRAFLGRAARFELRGYAEQLMSRRGAS